MTELTDAELNAKLLDRVEAARDFPNNTCPASRHVALIGEALAKGRPYPMLQEEPGHVAGSLLATVAALWEARASLSPWREIESAPKDKDILLLCCPKNSAEIGNLVLAGLWNEGTWVEAWNSNDITGKHWIVTHWMPLPPAPHSNGERDDGDKHTGRNWSDKDSGSASGRLADSDVHSSVALPSDAEPDVLCSVPDCPIHTPPPLESGEDAYACPLCGGWKHTGIGADECQCSPPPTPTQGEVEREKLNKASRQADAAMERMREDERLRELISKAVAWFKSLTPEQQEEHLKAQRESWVRGEMAMGESSVWRNASSDIAELVERLRDVGDPDSRPLYGLCLEAAAALLAIAAELERVRGYLKRAHEEAGEQEIELLDAKRQIRAQAPEIERLKSHLTEIANCEECLACQHVAMSALGGEVTFKSELMEANEQNRKLREALERIAQDDTGFGHHRKIARAALNQNEG